MGKTYVSRISKLREQKGLTQRQIAAELGIDVSTVRNWEKNRDGVRMFVRVDRLCKLFNCQPSDLYESVDAEDDSLNESEEEGANSSTTL
jgi:transcriptional regulator with XRE-family HTH domain